MPMPNIEPSQPAIPSAPREAARFWERGRLFYNAVLTVIVLLWLILTWPHFRPSLTLGSLEAFFVLGLLANLAYSTAYLAEFFIQLLASGVARRRARIALLVLGTLFALVLENYWISDEIYPYANNPPPNLLAGATTMPTAIASNMNFPAPLAVLGFLAAIGGLFLAVAAALIFWFARKPKFARITAIVAGAAAIIYLALLLCVLRSQPRNRSRPRTGKIFLRDRLPPRLLRPRRSHPTRRPPRHHPPHPLRRNHHLAQPPQRRPARLRRRAKRASSTALAASTLPSPPPAPRSSRR